MPVTLTTSQLAAAANPAAEPALLIDIATSSAEQFHFATQICSWGGYNYVPRILSASEITTGVGGGPAYELSAPKTMQVTFANDDGWFSRTRPDYFRGQPLTAREVFLDVNSAPVRTFEFLVTDQAMTAENQYRIGAEDVLAPVRRKFIPSNDSVITTSLYPNINRGATQAGADGLSRPIPFPFGRAFQPIYYVDQSSDGSHIYVAAVGSAYFTGSGAVVDWWDGGFSIVGLPAAFNSSYTPQNETRSTKPWSLRYAVRNGTREDGSSFSLPVTEIVLHPAIPPGDPIGRRFADLTWNHGSSAWTTPDEVLLQMLSDCFAGAHFDPTWVDSDSLLTAHSFYTTHSIYFDGALIEQRPLETWLAQWQHDAMTRLVMRDKIYLVPCGSKAATSSFGVWNVIDGTATYADVPTAQEFSRRVLYFKERTRDADYGPGNDEQQGDARGGTRVRSDVGSGAELLWASPFIGRPSVAGRVNQYWSAAAYYGRRQHTWDATVKAIGVEEGDRATYTSSIAGLSAQLVDVLGTQRRGGVYTFAVAETNALVTSVGVGADPAFGFFYQKVQYNGDCYWLYPGSDAYVLVVSHQLGRTPTRLSLIAWEGVLVSSLVVGAGTNDNEFTVATKWNLFSLPAGTNAETTLKGWYIWV